MKYRSCFAQSGRSICHVALVIFLFALARPLYAQSISESGETPATAALIEALLAQGVDPNCILGIGPDGIPVVCESVITTPTNPTAGIGIQAAQVGSLPPNTRSWSVIPSVVRNVVDTYVIEVNTNGPVRRVNLPGSLSNEPALPNAEIFHDDGIGVDRIANDTIWTAGPFRYNNAWPRPSHFLNDAGSPTGIHLQDLDRTTIVELDGTSNQQLISLSVGILDAAIAPVAVIPLSAAVQISPHLINVRNDNLEAAKKVRLVGGNLAASTNRLYQVVPDVFDFLVFFTTDHIETVPRQSSNNFVTGLHQTVQVNYTGTGRSPFNQSTAYGSAGKLLSVNLIAAGDRGIYASNVAHEITHQWSSYTNPALGLNDGTSHYSPYSNAASLLGGFQWLAQGNGDYMMNCSEGRNAAHQTPPIDRYMMGLIEGSQVPPYLLYSTNTTVPGIRCSSGEPIRPQDIVRVTTIEEIQRTHGVRSPGPASAQRDFAIGFVVESSGRLLTKAEMTFYDRLAEYFTKAVALSAPKPYVGANWQPITRFFGDDVTWTSAAPIAPVQDVSSRLQLQSMVTQLRPLANYPGYPYVYNITTEFVNQSNLPIYDLRFHREVLTNGNLWINASDYPERSYFIYGTGGPILPGQSFPMTFSIALRQVAPFDFFISTKGRLPTLHNAATLPTQVPLVLTTADQALPSYQLFLPLIGAD